jgi:ketosteroid isomerase-like protein
MSQENMEIVKRAMDAFNQSNPLVGAGDPLPWLREFCDPHLELDLSRRGIDPEIYHGYEGFMRLGKQDHDAWQEARFEVEEIIDAGDSVVLFTHNTGLAKSGIKLGVRVGQVLTLSGGKIARWQYFGFGRNPNKRGAFRRFCEGFPSLRSRVQEPLTTDPPLARMPG